MNEVNQGNNTAVAVSENTFTEKMEEETGPYKVPEKQCRKEFRSVAVPMRIWKRLWDMADANSRSPARQIEFLVQCAEGAPTDKEVQERYSALMNILTDRTDQESGVTSNV